MTRFLRLIACLLVLAILTSIFTTTLFADETGENTENTEQAETNDTPAEGEEAPAEEPAEGEEAPVEDSEPVEGEEAEAEDETPAEGEEAPAEEEEEEEEDEDVVLVLTDEEALARSTLVTENANLALYLDQEFERIGLLVKESGYVHWSNCVNALSDELIKKEGLRGNRLSNVAVKYGNATDLIVSSYYYSYKQSTAKEKTEYEILDNGVKITYSIGDAKVKVPLYVILEEDNMHAYVNTDEIKETAGYSTMKDEDEESTSDIIVLTELAMMPYMSAATTEDVGYMLVPDGSGARINLNNGKGNYNTYSEPLYGRDITQVKEVAPDEVEQAYLPVMAMVKGSNGLVMVASEGETFATVNASVSNTKNDPSSYNNCYFAFTLRSSDNYYMTGDSATIIVFEQGDGSIAVPKVGVRYYPITSKEETVTYGEIADVYRNYLIEEKGLTSKVEEGDAPLYVDFFGGTLKPKSIVGIPIDIKTAFTTFEQAIEIVSELKGLGVNDMTVTYNDWTNDSMSSKIDTADSAAGILGGKSGLKDLIKYLEGEKYDFYATITGNTFQSNGNGFWTLFDTAYRVSKSYSRQYTYNIAYGSPEGGVAPALLAPKSIAKLSKKVAKNMGKLDIPGAGLGIVSEILWSDFSNKNRTNRATTAQYIIDYYNNVREATGKAIADSPNAYLLPHIDAINNLTLQSSQFKLADADVPFYQMVVHGYISYATEPINASADSDVLILKAIAAGSNLHYDFIYEDSTNLVNTDYVKLFYAPYNGWLEEAAAQYKLADEILSTVSNATIVDYKQEGDVITTTYSNGVVTTVNLETGDITANGKNYNLFDYTNEKEVG